jgi:hypothetical protein
MPTPYEIKQYLSKSGDDSFRWNLPILEGHGWWFSYVLDEQENVLYVYQAMGKAETLKAKTQELCRHLGCDRIIFATRRNGRAFARLIGGKVIAEVVELDRGS